MFLAGRDIRPQVVKGMQGSARKHLAVAFVGRGAFKNVLCGSTDVRLVCDLSMGATDPDEIELLLREVGHNRIKQFSGLHGKVYLFDEYAIVGSANASLNALGSDSTNPRLMEAAHRVSERDQLEVISRWFEALWEDEKSRPINADDIAALRVRKEAQDAAIDLVDPIFECNHSGMTDDEQAAVDWPSVLFGQVADEERAARVEKAVWIWPRDRLAFASGPRWVLNFPVPHWSCVPDDVAEGMWVRVDDVFDNAFKLKGDDIGLGVSRAQHLKQKPRWWNKAAKNRFFEMLRKDGAAQQLLGLRSNLPKTGCSRTAWHTEQTSIEGRKVMRAFWERVRGK